jgi:hypothetical protein
MHTPKYYIVSPRGNSFLYGYIRNGEKTRPILVLQWSQYIKKIPFFLLY